jgi:uncharacterized metal-binding protein
MARREALPDNCPMVTTDLTDTREIYADAKNREIARVSAIVEATGYVRWTRVEETMEFARRLGFKKLGIAFCAGLREEGRLLERVLKSNGFEVVSAMCKTGAIPKEEIGIADSEKVRPGGFEAMCNPIGQARLLNDAGTDLNIMVGLCVGHDSLFIKYSDALVTCLVAKDRVMGHNPVAALYTSLGYYRKALYENHRPK